MCTSTFDKIVKNEQLRKMQHQDGHQKLALALHTFDLDTDIDTKTPWSF